MDEKELEQLKNALGSIENRVTTLEIVKRYDEKPKKPSVLKFLEDNAEIIAAAAIFIALNLVLWEKLSYAS